MSVRLSVVFACLLSMTSLSFGAARYDAEVGSRPTFHGAFVNARTEYASRHAYCRPVRNYIWPGWGGMATIVVDVCNGSDGSVSSFYAQ